MMSAPALAYTSIQRSGCSIIRWTSSGSLVVRRSASMMGGPKRQVGHKMPIHDVDMNQIGASALDGRHFFSASRPKSAARSMVRCERGSWRANNTLAQEIR